ncbi:hypothetical protein DPM19_09595 [Actinomadura craniellae]|uniref:Toprim domain-containing protein n=1 Tax=Actinomadura craniellae TaxID=2231787 RepID=A0A365H792_9ACTN|nr:toprim domain-containing protein [Actinomadura craniellae]RAY14994.1 hypothetical protein DPM19_09595 [Actinomadura craniellae]
MPFPDDRRQRLRDFLHQVAEQDTARLRTGRLPWVWWLEHAARHGRHGFVNTLLIAAQSPAAVEVRSYEDWQARGRQVRRGEGGIRILSRKDRPRPVFDLSQTDGGPLDELVPVTAAEAYERLRALAADLGLYVQRGQRWTYAGRADRLIRVDPALGDFGATTELAHQLAHVLRRGDHPDPHADTCHGARRVHADSVAYLALARLGLETSHLVFPPAAAWAGTDPRARPSEAVRQLGDQILRTTAHLHRRLPRPGESSPGAGVGPLGHERLGGGVPRPVRRSGKRSGRPTENRPDTTVQLAETPVGGENSARPRPDGQGRPAKRRPSGGQSFSPARGTAHAQALLAVHRAAHRFFQSNLAGSWVPGYLSDRGFSADVPQRWELGYAPKAGRTLTDHLRRIGHSDQVILASGLARRTRTGALFDAFRDRLVFPLRTGEGAVVAFIGRRPDGAPGPKYLNSPETALFRKGEVLFGLHETRDRLAAGARLVIVEGPLDAIAVNTTDGYAAVGPCGTALTAAQLAALGRHADLDTAGVLLALDGDPAGQASTIRAWLTLSHLTGPLDALVLPDERDPADVLRAGGPPAVRTMLRFPVPLADLVVDACIDRYGGTLEFAEQKLTAVRAATALIARMPAVQVPRQVARLHARTGVEVAIVTDALTEAVGGEPAGAPALAARSFPVPPGPNSPEEQAATGPVLTDPSTSPRRRC